MISRFLWTKVLLYFVHVWHRSAVKYFDKQAKCGCMVVQIVVSSTDQVQISICTDTDRLQTRSFCHEAESSYGRDCQESQKSHVSVDLCSLFIYFQTYKGLLLAALVWFTFDSSREVTAPKDVSSVAAPVTSELEAVSSLGEERGNSPKLLLGGRDVCAARPIGTPLRHHMVCWSSLSRVVMDRLFISSAAKSPSLSKQFHMSVYVDMRKYLLYSKAFWAFWAMFNLLWCWVSLLLMAWWDDFCWASSWLATHKVTRK